MRRGDEGLLSIRWSDSGAFLGTVGWSERDRAGRTACFGRLMVDRRALARLRGLIDPAYPGVALDAALALRDCAFERMELKEARTWYLEGNTLAARVNQGIGMARVGRGVRLRPDGSAVNTVELRLTRPRWLRLRGRR
jgi:RimJ/RimL family protein N-acetyltransferase